VCWFYKSAFNPNGSPIVEITRFNSWNFHFIPMSIYSLLSFANCVNCYLN
jgi:hypothetical protein